MYSKKTSGNQENSQEYIIMPPPGYDGSRFRSRSDGRDDSIPPYNNELHNQIYSTPKEFSGYKNFFDQDDIETVNDSPDDEIQSVSEEKVQEKTRPVISLPSLFKNGIGQEELLIIALIIILATEKNCSGDLILMLALLLCM